MKIIKSVSGMQRWAERARRQGKTIGFVPTMGALHAGHLSLIRAARKRCDRVVVSLFVNPVQFGPKEDYARYPRDPAGDSALCRKEKADILFIPTVRGIYPRGPRAAIKVGGLGEILEGASRPDHFSGVATVVAKLFQIVAPHRAFFGQKDYQQAAVIRKVMADLNLPVRLTVCPTFREPDGVAMSSRNRYLSPVERRAAQVLYKALCYGARRVRGGSRASAAVRKEMIRLIRREPLARIDYVAIVDPESLKRISRIRGPVMLLLAVRIGRTRLIDNRRIRPSPSRWSRKGRWGQHGAGSTDR